MCDRRKHILMHRNTWVEPRTANNSWRSSFISQPFPASFATYLLQPSNMMTLLPIPSRSRRRLSTSPKNSRFHSTNLPRTQQPVVIRPGTHSVIPNWFSRNWKCRVHQHQVQGCVYTYVYEHLVVNCGRCCIYIPRLLVFSSRCCQSITYVCMQHMYIRPDRCNLN